MATDNQQKEQVSKNLHFTSLAYANSALLLAVIWAVAYIDEPSKWLILPTMAFFLGLISEGVSIVMCISVNSNELSDNLLEECAENEKESHALMHLILERVHNTKYGAEARDMTPGFKEFMVYGYLFFTVLSGALMTLGLLFLTLSVPIKLFGVVGGMVFILLFAVVFYLVSGWLFGRLWVLFNTLMGNFQGNHKT